MKCRVTWSEGEGDKAIEYTEPYESRTAVTIRQIPSQFAKDLASASAVKARVTRVELLEY